VKPYTVGLTGGIGSGKSVVAGLFAKRGVAVIDTDEIAHEFTRPGGGAIEAIRAAFGAGLIGADGALDRDGMRKLVFGDGAARKKLEAILHPLIREESSRRRTRAQSPYAILVVPLLVEGGVDRSRYARVLVLGGGSACDSRRAGHARAAPRPSRRRDRQQRDTRGARAPGVASE